jgi:hypothetical protein
MVRSNTMQVQTGVNAWCRSAAGLYAHQKSAYPQPKPADAPILVHAKCQAQQMSSKWAKKNRQSQGAVAVLAQR